MEVEAAGGAEGAQVFETRAVSGGVELGGDDDHGLACQRGTKGGELAGDDIEIVDRVAVGGVAGVNQVSKQASALDVAQEARAQSDAGVRAFDQAGEVGNDKGAAGSAPLAGVGGDDAEVGFERGEGIVGDFGTGSGDARDERGLANVGETDQADVGEQLELEAQMALFAVAAATSTSLAPGTRLRANPKTVSPAKSATCASSSSCSPTSA